MNTIADYDKIVVMSRGKVVEMGPPYELIMKGEVFAEMVRQTGKAREGIEGKARRKYN